LAIGISLSLITPAFGISNQNSSLTITSDPSEALVLLDHHLTNYRTPCTIRDLTPGKHYLEFFKAKYQNNKQLIVLKPGPNTIDIDMAETFWYYMWINLPSLLLGALMTLLLTCIAIFDGIVLGTLIGVARVVHNKFLNIISGIYVDFIRGTPLLVQIFMIYFGIPPLLGVIYNHNVPVPIDPFVSAIIALSLNSGAYIAEIIRSGIQSIDKGQMEAARSLGMTYSQAMKSIVLPQAMKRVIPPLGNEFIAMLKDSSLVSVIGMEELVRKAQIIVTRTYRPTETWLEVGFIFLLLTIPFTRLVAKLEKRLKTGD
jgi:polar amino acid transport system permease protein